MFVNAEGLEGFPQSLFCCVVERFGVGRCGPVTVAERPFEQSWPVHLFVIVSADLY